MIIDEKGKLFGKISIVDIAIILFILLTVAALVWRFTGMQEVAEKIQNVQCRYECMVENVRIESITALKNDIGKNVYDLQKTAVGKLISVEDAPYECAITNSEGEITMAQVPGRYSAKIVIEGTGKKTDLGYVSGAGYEISAGSKQAVSLYSIDVEMQVINITEIQ